MGIAAHIGQVGALEATGPYIDTLGAALTGARTAAQAVVDGDLANGEEKTLTIYAGTGGEPSSGMLMWRATWDAAGARWARVSEMVSVGSIADEAAVSVVVTSAVPDLPSISDNEVRAVRNGEWVGVNLDVASIHSLVAAPATPTSAGTAGQWAQDGVYVYFCVATNTWWRFIGARTWT